MIITFIERNYFPMNKAGGPMTTQLTNPADVMRANGFEIARRLEAHAQAARGALADQTCRALASDSRIWSAWCTERNVSVLPAEPTTVVGFVDAQAELKSPATVRRYIATIAHMHRAAGLADPTKAEIVRLAVKRLVRAKGTRQRQAAPLDELAADRILATQPKTLVGLRHAALADRTEQGAAGNPGTASQARKAAAVLGESQRTAPAPS